MTKAQECFTAKWRKKCNCYVQIAQKILFLEDKASISSQPSITPFPGDGMYSSDLHVHQEHTWWWIYTQICKTLTYKIIYEIEAGLCHSVIVCLLKYVHMSFNCLIYFYYMNNL